jgi:hypothetical protein
MRRNGNSWPLLFFFAAIGAPLVVASAAARATFRLFGVEVRLVAGFIGLRGWVFDAASGRSLSGRLEIRDAGGEPVGFYYAHLLGVFTEEDGSFEVSLPAGRYSVEVHYGIDYLSEWVDVEVAVGRGVALAVSLAFWVSLRERGFVNGDGHAHFYTDKRPDDEMAARVRRICLV